MQIGELAKRACMSVSRIRFYEARGLLPKVPRQANGYRSYGEEAVAFLRFVDQAQRLGFSLAEVAKATPNPGGPLPSSTNLVAELRRKEAEIDRLIEATMAKKHAIAALLEELQCVG